MRASGRARQIIAAVLAAGTLAALLGGIPALLLAMDGSPLPARLLSGQELLVALSRPYDARWLTSALELAGWIGWLVFAWSSVAEMATRLARRPGRQGRGRSPFGRLAAHLVTTITLLAAAPQSGDLVHASTATSALADLPAAPPGHTSHPGKAVEKIYVVQPGDTLWEIAARRLGDPLRHREIFALNHGHVQRDGRQLEDPDLIRPGWRLLLPDDAITHPKPSTEPSSSSPASPEPSSSPSPAPSAARPPDAYPQPVTVDLPSGLVVGLSFAAGVSAAILTARLRARRQDRPPHAAVPLGRAARLLRAAHLQAAQQEPPTSTASAPATAATGRRPAWSAASAPVASRRRPYSSLPLAVTPDRRAEIAVDVVAVPGIGLTGPGAAHAVRALVLTLLTQRGERGHAEVVIPRDVAAQVLGQPVSPATGIPGLVVTATLEEALHRLELDVMQRTRLAAQTSQTSQEDLAAYRAAHPDDLLPLVVLVAAPGHDHTPALHPILDQGRRLDVAGVLLGPWPSGATCTLDAAARVTHITSPDLAHLVGNHLFGLDPAETADVLQVLNAARDRPKPPPSFGQRPPIVEATTPAAPSKLRLRVLGQVRLQIGLSDVRSKRRSTHEVLTYLAVHRQGATTEQIAAALWPDDAHEQAAKRLYDAISSLRSVLRTELAALAGDIVITTQGGYRLNPDLVEVDLWQFDQALAAARHAHDPGERMRHLQTAITLAAGPLADGRYEWADQPRDELVRRTVEAISRAADLVHHDPERALRILAPALTLDPYNEALYQQRMLIQVKSGQAGAARATYAQLETRLREIDAAPDERSEQILRTTHNRPDHTPRPRRE